jgi:hypothetical protein
MTAVVRRMLLHSRMYRLVTSYRYVAVDLPRTTASALGAALLGFAATHVYILVSEPVVPLYLVIYVWVLVAVCIAAGVALALAPGPIARVGRAVGAGTSVVFLVGYVTSRLTGLPALPGVRGWWDYAPGTLAALCAVAYLAISGAVLLGITVARPEEQHWHD